MAQRRKRMIVLMLAIGLAVLGAYGWATGTATRNVLQLIAVGVALAILYAVRGGTLPPAVYRYANVVPDDHPGNLPPRVYLPILIAAIVVATMLYVWTVTR